MALANSNQGFRPSASRPEVDYDQSEQCMTSLAKFDDFIPENKEILQLRSGCSHITFIYSAHKEIFMKFFELRQETCTPLQYHLLQSWAKYLTESKC
jgi:hypothetical protein